MMNRYSLLDGKVAVCILMEREHVYVIGGINPIMASVMKLQGYIGGGYLVDKDRIKFVDA